MVEYVPFTISLFQQQKGIIFHTGPQVGMKIKDQIFLISFGHKFHI